MDRLYVLIKRIDLLNANAEQCAYIVGPPSPFSFVCYADAVAFVAKSFGLDLTTRWVLPIYHGICEEQVAPGMLKREAFGIKESKANLLAPQIRDELKGNFNLSLILCFDFDPFASDLDDKMRKLRNRLPTRMAGGSFFVWPSDNDKIQFTTNENWTDVFNFRQLWPESHIIIHRPELVEDMQSYDDLVRLTVLDPKSDLSPLFIGFEPISERVARANTRDNYGFHEFCDPLISVGEWISPYAIRPDTKIYWAKESVPGIKTVSSFSAREV
ncbi:type I-F CRISPR-associated protein Csy2 [Pseudomonas luteola]